MTVQVKTTNAQRVVGAHFNLCQAVSLVIIRLVGVFPAVIGMRNTRGATRNDRRENQANKLFSGKFHTLQCARQA